MAKTAEPKWNHMAWVKKRRVNKQPKFSDRKHFTGFCNNGHCEGTRPKNYRGVPMKTCPHWLTCVCICHVQQDEMFEIIGEERRLVENTEVVREKSPYIMPDPMDYTNNAAKKTIIDTASMDGEEITPDHILRGTVFNQTPSGQRARGQLEYQVLAAVNRAMEIWPDELEITPKRISEYIASREKMQAPSPGAIDAVWKRWVKMGFAEVGSKPVQFIDYTAKENQTIEQLEAAKAAYKRGERLAQASDRRTKIHGLRK